MWAGIATEKTYAARTIVHRIFHALDTGPSGRKMGGFKRPVQAIEAVEVAGFKEDGKVIETHFRTAIIGVVGVSRTRAPGANPVGNAIGRERIVVKGYKTTGAAICLHTGFTPVPYPAVPLMIHTRFAAMKAKFAFGPVRVGGRTGRQPIHFPGFGMDLLDSVPALVGPVPDAGRADSYAA
ncbi:hypothetical protein SBDP1_800011 [Syntrophobacter sp. SbD1]|nr:hypothetical protein SBDP1_800011 [Syntrophobacter sp. SbD1]